MDVETLRPVSQSTTIIERRLVTMPSGFSKRVALVTGSGRGIGAAIARELAPWQITVNAICPGFIDTEMTRAMPKKIYDEQIRKIPMNRVGRPEDVAAVVGFLCSDAAGYVTGEVINVGGGYRT